MFSTVLHTFSDLDQIAVIVGASSIAVSSLVFFIIGYLCGCRFGCKGHKPSDSGKVSTATLDEAVPTQQQFQIYSAQPMYEDVIPSVKSEDKQRAFELMMENVAYGTITTT